MYIVEVGIYSLRYLRDVIFKHIPENKKRTHDAEIREHDVIKGIFTPQLVTQLAETLISKFLRLTKDDFELWQSDPEEYVCDTAIDDYKYSIRSASQTLFAESISSFEQILPQFIIQLLNSVSYGKKNISFFNFYYFIIFINSFFII